MTMVDSLFALALCLLAAQALSVSLAIKRCARRAAQPAGAMSIDRPGVTLVRPLRGVESHSRATLAASLALTWPRHEVLFCVADANDPVVALVHAALKAHPHGDARLLIGADRIGPNPKLNNMAKGYRAAKYDWLCFADSNLLIPPDYLEQAMAARGPGVGAVSAPPAGSAPEDFWGEVECAFLNTFQARWQYAIDTLGQGFCQGKTLLFHRSVLGARGIAALADEAAEDAALTRAVRAAGLRVRLVGPPFAQPLGPRTAANVWARQLRWARLRRATFPACFALESALGFWPAAIALGLWAHAAGYSAVDALAGLFCIWYGCEAALAALAGWPMAPRSLVACVLRDLVMPVLWCAAWAGDTFTWHGAELKVSVRGRGVQPG